MTVINKNSIKLKKAIIEAVTEALVKEHTSYKNFAEASIAVELIEIDYDSAHKKFTIHHLDENLMNALTKKYSSFKVRSEGVNKEFVMDRTDAKNFHQELINPKPKKSLALSTRAFHKPVAPFSSATLTTIQSLPGFYNSTVTTAGPGNFSSPISFEFTVKYDYVNKLFNCLVLLKIEVNKKAWDTKGIGFFSRHVPRHIKQLRDMMTQYDLSEAMKDSGHGSDWQTNIKSCFKQTEEIMSTVSKNSFFRDAAVAKFYNNVKQEIKTIHEEYPAPS